MIFNEIDPYCCDWLRNLYPEAEVLEKDVKNVSRWELWDARRVHLFGGIGGWEEALRLAGWEDQHVWTGSCPCQPFSKSGRRAGHSDQRDLWPWMFHFISECRPPVCFGEQIATRGGIEWFTGVRDDMEMAGYAVGSAVLPACCVGTPHNRPRLFWVATTNPVCLGRERKFDLHQARPCEDRLPQARHPWLSPDNPFANWRDLLATPGTARLPHGIPSTLAIRPALKAFGNSIVPAVAALFIRAFMDIANLTNTPNPETT